MAPATKEFFASKTYAVAGASKDPKKIGNKVSHPTETLVELLGAVQAFGGNVSTDAVPPSEGGHERAGQAMQRMLQKHIDLMEAEKRARIGPKFCEVVKWYKEHGLDAIPVHPKEDEVEGLHTVASIFDLTDPGETSLSIITPPQVSLPILKTALLELDIAYIWLQPGAEDDELKEWVEGLPDEDLKNRVIFGGPCILVEGEALAKEQGKL